MNVADVDAFNRELMEALGLTDDLKVTGITIRSKVGQHPTVTIERFVNEEDEQNLKKVFARYKIK